MRKVEYEEEDVKAEDVKVNKRPTPSYVSAFQFPACCGIGVAGEFAYDDVENLVEGLKEALTTTGTHDEDSDEYEEGEYDENERDELSEKTIVLATTTVKQTSAAQALEQEGFRPIIRFKSKTTGHMITLWARGNYTIIRPAA